MRHLLTATVAATLLGAVGCVEPIDNGTTNPTLPKTAGEQQFDADVSPMLEQNCAGCHTGAPESTPTKFLGVAGKNDNYAKVTLDDGVIGGWNPALAGLLTKGEHADGQARAWTGSEAGMIEGWMGQEAIDRNITIDPPVPPPPVVVRSTVTWIVRLVTWLRLSVAVSTSVWLPSAWPLTVNW